MTRDTEAQPFTPALSPNREASPHSAFGPLPAHSSHITTLLLECLAVTGSTPMVL